MIKILVVGTLFVFLISLGQSSWADQCASFFGGRNETITLNQGLEEFKAPLRFIEIVDHKNYKMYSGISAKDHYEKLLVGHLKLYESPSKLRRSRTIDWDLQKALSQAKNINEAKEIFTQYFLKRHKLKDLENDSIIPYQLDSPNIAKVKIELNPDGSIRQLQIAHLLSGTYLVRLSAPGAIKEIIFRVK